MATAFEKKGILAHTLKWPSGLVCLATLIKKTFKKPLWIVWTASDVGEAVFLCKLLKLSKELLAIVGYDYLWNSVMSNEIDDCGRCFVEIVNLDPS